MRATTPIERKVNMASSEQIERPATPTFDALFVTEYPKIVALAAAIVNDRSRAEDIAQEAMTRLSHNWDHVRGLDKPGAWLRRVTINVALSHRRKILNEARALLRLDRQTDTLSAPPVEHEAVWAAVAGLSRRQRAVVALHFLEDRSIEEIADILEISPATARVHLHRARQTLRDRLETEENDR